MPSQSFTPVSWVAGQLIDEDSLDQVNNNEVWLRDHSIDTRYIHEWGATVDKGIKLGCGRIYIGPQAVDLVYGTVAFPLLFTPTALPVITTSIISEQQNKFMHVIYGIGQHHPDHRGFQFKINVRAAQEPNQVFENPIHLCWIAMGY